ncbi:MAG: BrnT family toxin [Burkholderiaceae bacterium]|nr:BrnT family toxin [Burkholderiaceae bacterium]
MQFEFDQAKDAINVTKHGVSLALARELEWDLLLCHPDARRDYGELREVGFAPLARRVYVVVFVQRADVLRIISLRRANRREVIRYDKALQALRVRAANG